MQKEIELEGSPAEATWAMITVIVVIIVVIIFCCFVPFWRALKKRDHHWEDPENDPRWDLDNFQFSSALSPRLERRLGEEDYNSLSVCSNKNSSTHTSNSAVNNSFRNNNQLPRFIDQVEFKVPKKYDDGFTKGDVDECSEDTDDNKSAITSSSTPPQGKTNRSSPVKKLHKMYRKQLENSVSNEQAEKNIPSKHSAESKLNMATQANQMQSRRTKTVSPNKSSEPQPVAPGPVAPPKRNSKPVTTGGPAKPTSSVNNQIINGDSPSISPPTRKTYKKTKKQPTANAVSGDGKVISSS